MSERKLAVFDFDGVLLRGDSFAGYLRWRTRQRRWRLLAALPLLPLLPLLGYARTLPFAARIFARALTLGLTPRRFENEIALFSEEWLSRPSRRIQPLLQRLQAHQAAGEHVVVVSGTAQLLLDTLLQQIGVSDVTALGTELQFGGAGLRARRHNFGAAKLVRMAEAGLPAHWHYCYSDSAADLPILAAADQAILVDPKPAEEAQLRAALGARLVECVRTR